MSRARYGKRRTRTEWIELSLLLTFLAVLLGGMAYLKVVNG